MKRVLAIFAVVSLVINGYLVYDVYFQGGKGSGWQTSGGSGEGQELTDLTVIVPQPKLADTSIYDYNVFAQMYWHDFNTGNWSDMRLTINGNLRHWYQPDTKEVTDGFWNKHNALHYEQDTQASFEVYVASSDAEPLSIPGSIDGQRHEYRDLSEEIPVETYTKGTVSIDRLPRVNQALTYKGTLDSFINPNREIEKSLDEQIYGNGQQIRKNDNGTVVQSKYYANYDITLETFFNWSADRAVMYKGYKTLHLNITSDIFEGTAIYNEQIWISSDSPFPIRRSTRTNQTWTDENGTFKYIIETNNTLQDKGYTPGNIEIPWGGCKGIHWAERHPDGEYQQWKYYPVGGAGISASSFDFKTEEADQYAREHSAGLQAFLAKFDKPGRGVTGIYANYNASKSDLDVNGKAGSYRWNLTYGYFPTEDEWDEARETHNYNFTYNIVLLKNVTKDMSKPLQNEYIEDVTVEHDWGLRRDYAVMPRDWMPSETLTLASSEDIMMKHPLVKAKVADRNGEIEWGDFETTYGLTLAGLGGSANPGYELIELLTGIVMPSADYAWAVQFGTVYESGNTFSAAVDTTTGQLVYVTEIEGTALMGLFD